MKSISKKVVVITAIALVLLAVGFGGCYLIFVKDKDNKSVASSQQQISQQQIEQQVAPQQVEQKKVDFKKHIESEENVFFQFFKQEWEEKFEGVAFIDIKLQSRDFIVVNFISPAIEASRTDNTTSYEEFVQTIKLWTLSVKDLANKQGYQDVNVLYQAIGSNTGKAYLTIANGQTYLK